MPLKFKIVRRKNDQFGVQFTYNSEILMWSGNLPSRSDAIELIETIKRAIPTAALVDISRGEYGEGFHFEIVQSKDNQFYTRLVSNNGETIMRSETYQSKLNAIRSAEVLIKHAPNLETNQIT